MNIPVAMQAIMAIVATEYTNRRCRETGALRRPSVVRQAGSPIFPDCDFLPDPPKRENGAREGTRKPLSMPCPSAEDDGSGSRASTICLRDT